MSALFTIYDPKGEIFEVPAHKLASLKQKGWSTTLPTPRAKSGFKAKTTDEDAKAE